MNWRTDARIWALIGFGVGAVTASGGSINSPLDALFGGLLQSILWFFVARFIIKRGQRNKKENEDSVVPTVDQKKTAFLFDRPVKSDWLFWVFMLLLGANTVNGLSNVFASGGISTSSAGIISGLIDGSFRVILAYFPIIPIIYLVRKLVRKSKKQQ